MISRPRSIGALSLIALWGLVSTCCTTQPKPGPMEDCYTAQNHNIEIGSVVSCKWVILHSNAHGQGNTINWRATDPTKKVKIWFDDKSVFPSLDCPGGQNVCHSGALNPGISGDPPPRYTYHAQICENVTSCGPDIDPGIIIVP